MFKKISILIILVILFSIGFTYADSKTLISVEVKNLENQINLYEQYIVLELEGTYSDGTKKKLNNYDFEFKLSKSGKEEVYSTISNGGLFVPYFEENITLEIESKHFSNVKQNINLSIKRPYEIKNLEDMVLKQYNKLSDVQEAILYFPILKSGETISVKVNGIDTEIVRKGDYFAFVKVKSDEINNIQLTVSKEGVEDKIFSKDIWIFGCKEPTIISYSYNETTKEFFLSAENQNKNIPIELKNIFEPLNYNLNNYNYLNGNISNVEIGDTISYKIEDIFGNKFEKNIKITDAFEMHNEISKIILSKEEINISQNGISENTIVGKVFYNNGTTDDLKLKDLVFKNINNTIKIENGLYFLINLSNDQSKKYNVEYLKNEELFYGQINFKYSVENQNVEPVLKELKLEKNSIKYLVEDTNGFDLEKLNFIGIYSDKTEKQIPLKLIEIYSEDNVVKIEKNIMYFKDYFPFNEKIEIQFKYQENNKEYILKVDFTKIRDEGTYLIDLTTEEKQVNLMGKELDLNKVIFKVHYTDSEVKKVKATELKMITPHKFKEFIEVNNDYIQPLKEFSTNEEVYVIFRHFEENNYYDEKIYFYNEYEKQKETNNFNTNFFLDIQNHWAQKYIEKLSKANCIVGYEDNLYYPDKYVTRAEVSAFLVKVLNLKEEEKVPFTDVSSYHWAYSDIAKVYKAKIFNGYSSTTFEPDKPITREELAVILLRVHKEKQDIVINGNNVFPFYDSQKISSWSYNYVMEAKSLGLIEGRPNNLFAPKDKTTRAEISAILSRMLK